MSSVDGSILAALEKIDPDEAALLQEELSAEEVERVETEEDVILVYDFD